MKYIRIHSVIINFNSIKYSTAFLLAIFSFSCAKKDDIVIKIATIVDRVNQGASQRLLSDVRHLQVYKNITYAADYNLNEILVFDEDLSPISIVGTPGEGPGEIRSLESFTIIDDSIFIGNHKSKIEVFISDKHVNTIKLPNNVPNVFFAKGLVNIDGQLFSNQRSLASTLIKFNTDSFARGGVVHNYPDNKAKLTKNFKFLKKYRNNIIAVLETKPIIEIYDQNFDLLLSYNYSEDFPILQNTLKVNDRFPQKSNSFFKIAEAITVHNDYLYILIYTAELGKGTRKNVNLNNVLVYNLSNFNSGIYLTEVIQLPKEGWYTSLSVLDAKTVFAFDNRSSNLQKLSTSRLKP
jgi:hypothetical protein